MWPYKFQRRQPEEEDLCTVEDVPAQLSK